MATDLSYKDAISTSIATTALNSLAAATYTDYLTEIDNTEAGGSCYQYGLVRVELGADLTCAAGAPYVGVWMFCAADGTNYPNPPTGTGAPPAQVQGWTIPANASAVFRRGDLLIPIPLPPLKLKFKLYHGLHGTTAWNATGNTATLYRWRDRIVTV